MFKIKRLLVKQVVEVILNLLKRDIFSFMPSAVYSFIVQNSLLVYKNYMKMRKMITKSKKICSKMHQY